MTRAVSVEELLRRPVAVHGIRLGQPSDIVFDLETRRVVGIDVLCGDARRRFLPLAAARIRDDEIAIGSSLILLEEDDSAFYHRRGRTFRSLLGKTVERAGVSVGTLADVLMTADGAVEALAVLRDEALTLLPAGPTLTIGTPGRAPAA